MTMSCYTITRLSNFIGNPRVKSFHANMFHGLAERDGKEYPHDTHVYANESSPSRLHISRTGTFVPDVCQPSNHLVVSSDLAEELSDLPNVRVLPVVFKRLVDVDFRTGDMAYEEKWHDADPCTLLRTLPDVKEFHDRIGTYWELQGMRWNDIVSRYPDARELNMEHGTPPLDEAGTIRLSRTMLEECPVICQWDIIVSESVFQTLAPSLDLDYFLVREHSF